jgi:hypothetical protein
MSSGIQVPLWQFSSVVQVRQDIAADHFAFRDRLPQDWLRVCARGQASRMRRA